MLSFSTTGMDIYSTPKIVKLAATADKNTDDETVALTLSLPGFAAARTLPFTITDNDRQKINVSGPPGLMCTQMTTTTDINCTLTMVESRPTNSTVDLSAMLSFLPHMGAAAETVTVTSSATAHVAVTSSGTLTFSNMTGMPTAWDQQHPITLQSVSDSDAVDDTATITVQTTSPTGGGPGTNTWEPVKVIIVVTVTDIDTMGIQLLDGSTVISPPTGPVFNMNEGDTKVFGVQLTANPTVDPYILNVASSAGGVSLGASSLSTIQLTFHPAAANALPAAITFAANGTVDPDKNNEDIELSLSSAVTIGPNAAPTITKGIHVIDTTP